MEKKEKKIEELVNRLMKPWKLPTKDYNHLRVQLETLVKVIYTGKESKFNEAKRQIQVRRMDFINTDITLFFKTLRDLGYDIVKQKG